MDHILLTGGSGLLGSRIQEYVKSLGNTHLTCLDRSHGYDLTDPKTLLPLFKSDIKPAFTHVIHAAACTSFSPHYNRLYQVNVMGTATLAKLCNELIPPLKRFTYVSTAWQCGLGESKVHSVPYTLTKHLAEDYLIGKKDPLIDSIDSEFKFPVTIVRPSVLFDHTSTSIIWMFLLVYALGESTVPLNSMFDAVPAKWAAEAIVTLTLKNKNLNGCYNISSNYPTQTIERIFRGFDDFFARRGTAHELSVIAERYKCVSQQELNDLIDSSNLDDRMKRTCKYALEKFLPIASESKLFDNTNTLSEGIDRPPPLVSYLEQVLQHSTEFSLEQMIEDEMKDHQ